MILKSSADNDMTPLLNDKTSSIQSVLNTLQAAYNAMGINTSQSSYAAALKPRQTRSPEWITVLNENMPGRCEAVVTA